MRSNGNLGEDAPIGDVISNFADDAKAYAAAEIAFYRELAVTKARIAGSVAAFGGVAVLLVLAALVSIVVGALLILQPIVGPAWATVIVTGTVILLAALFGWLAWKRVSEMLSSDL